MSQKNSVERKRGNRLGFWLFQAAVIIFGLRGAYGLLYFVGFHYLIFDRTAVAASMAYVRRRFPEHSPLRRRFDAYLLFVNQGKSLIDRYYAASGRGDIAIEIRGYDNVLNLLGAGNRGFILLTAHVGNWQVAMTALRKFGRTVHLMMRREDNAAVKEALNIDSEGEMVKILYTDDSLGGVVEAMKAIDRGDLVSIMGDRTYEYSAMEASFLGEKVRFPYGAFSLASAAQCPVVVLLSAKAGLKKYITDVSHVIQPPAGARRNKETAIKAAVQEFAGILEEYVREYPYQWFVFRDVWASNV
ncbi:MAG TPA: lysophospholipid acyltransferase family protein [Nitrospirota bacterium]|nr:lysophospholipid acyltransferase family protein [Nitrospirota bacterium]